MTEETSWNEYKRLVLTQLEQDDDRIEKLNEKLNLVATRVTVLETKAVLFGIIAGLVSAGIVEFITKMILK